MDWKLELVGIPVSDVDRAKSFYTEKAGFIADHDHRVSDEIRFVQLTPPGSACSITLGIGIVDTPPGSVQGMQLVVSDINAARAELAERGVEVSEVHEFDWGSFVFFSDPDGNDWAVQQLPARDEQARRRGSSGSRAGPSRQAVRIRRSRGCQDGFT
jgi:predicted enzyme related to lactoylglutathione lyase